MEGYIGEIRLWAPDWAPRGWALCDGQLLAISQYQALFSILGSQYGGDARTTFALPDFRGRVAVQHGSDQGQTNVIGQKGGLEAVILTVNQLPAHSHTPLGNSKLGSDASPAQNFAADNPAESYRGNTNTQMAATTDTGQGQAHENRMPYQVCSYIICLEGIYPSRS